MSRTGISAAVTAATLRAGDEREWGGGEGRGDLVSEQCLATVSADGIHVEVDVYHGGVSSKSVGNQHLEEVRDQRRNMRVRNGLKF